MLDKENGEEQLRAWLLARWVLKLVIVTLLFSNKVTSYLYTLLIWLVGVLVGCTGKLGGLPLKHIQVYKQF